ncbi:hypothetical protein EI534_15200 [Pseudomonas frederiksbergensis]|nr:hypothetical protein [Pseudomonas frederiksbergensis]
MNKMFTSLMLDTLRQRVDSATELKKANLEGQQLLAMLKAIPSFKDMARNRLVEKLRESHPGIELDKVFVNRGSYTGGLESRPAGALLEVHLECLSRNLSPSYVIGSDGVYDRPNTTDSQFKIPGLDIYQVERLLENARRNLSSEHLNSLDQYWKAAVSGQIDGNPSSTHKDVLQQSVAKTLMAELSLSVIGGRLEPHQGERVADILLSGNGSSLYQVLINNVGEYPVRLPSGFVVDMSGLGNAELLLNKHHHNYVLYTPDRGFEFFLSSNDLHAQLCSRLSISGGGISYSGLQESAFQYCADSRIKSQKDEVAQLFGKSNYNGAGLFASLENIQHLDTLRSGWLQSFEALQSAIKRTEWPNWLNAASPSVQERYSELEYSMVKYNDDFQHTQAPYFSLRAYARRQVADWSKSALGVEVDADTIRVRSRYELKAVGKTILQEDNRTLTEFVSFGLHDVGYAPQIFLEGAEASGLTSDKLEKWLHTVDIRKAFVETRTDNPPLDYREALSNKLISTLNFDLWSAHYSGQFGKADFDLVNRAIAGDSSVLINGVNFVGTTQPLTGVLVFQGSQRDQGPQQVYLKSTEGRHEFLRFNNFVEFASQLKIWMSNDSAYATSLLNPDDMLRIGKQLQQAKGLQWDLNNIRVTSVELHRNAHDPLAGAVQVDYRWSLATVNRIAPLNYRAALPSYRQQQARLNTELKALYTVEARETGFPSYAAFSRDLIKKRVEEVLRSRGSFVEVNPDLIYVQISPYEDFTLSELIVQERAFEPPSSPNWDPLRDYPRFHWSGAHPALDVLNIKDIASWSKTLRPGEKYIELLKAQSLETAPFFTFKREVYFKRQLCEMSLALLSQYFDGKLDSEQFRSLERIINRLRTPEVTQHYEAVVNTESAYGFRLETSRKVEGVYILRAVTSRGIEDFIYTPNAPDDLAFRSANDFVWSIRDRRNSLREYYINRVAIVDKKVINDYFDGLEATVSDIPPPKPEVNTRIKDLRRAYETHVRRVIADVDEQTTSLGEIIGGLIYDNVKLAATIISMVIPPVGLAVTAVEVIKNVYDGLNAHYYGENKAAFTHFRDAVLGLVSLGQAGQGGESVTKLQRTFIELAGDANTVVGLMSTALGQTLGHERLLEIIQQVLDEPDASTSKTTVI